MTPTNAHRSMANAAARAERARSTGRWPDWRWHSCPGGPPKARSWARDFNRVAENGVFSVLVREVETAWGRVQHAMISEVFLAVHPTWAEKQRIKDELFGRERVAVEVFPKRSQLVDGADAFHLFVLPADMALPFGLHDAVPDAPA